MIDAASGALLASFDTLRSVAADVTLIDRDFDGLVDHAIVADTGGNLYRVDFVDPLTRAPLPAASWAIHHTARTAGAGRKFQFAPAALATNDRVFVALGSGDRERPLQTNYPYVESILNRFYMFVDPFSTPSVPVDLDGGTMADFTSNTTCATTLGTSLNGWYMDLNSGRGEQTVTSASKRSCSTTVPPCVVSAINAFAAPKLQNSGTANHRRSAQVRCWRSPIWKPFSRHPACVKVTPLGWAVLPEV